MSNHLWFRVVAGVLSVAWLVAWFLLAIGVIDTPPIEVIAGNGALALAIGWGIIAGFSK